MSRRVAIAVAAVMSIALGSMAGGWFGARVESPVATERATDGVVPPARPSGEVAVARTHADDLIARYMDLRDAVDPVPRLAFLEEAGRSADPSAAADLFAQAMVDPDERVRIRAGELLDRVAPSERSPDRR